LKRISSGDFSLFLSFHGRKRKENKTKVILDNVICSFLLLVQKKRTKENTAKTITSNTQGQLCPAFWRADAHHTPSKILRTGQLKKMNPHDPKHVSFKYNLLIISKPILERRRHAQNRNARMKTS
jgi:hypothetical protein